MALPQKAGLDSPKARQILEGAKDAFLELGYEGTSVDEIVRRARVSKGTLYNYFPDKVSVFVAVVDEECQKHADRVFTVDIADENIEDALRSMAHDFTAFVLSPFAQGIYRVAVAESQRFPEVGRAFYEVGPDLGVRRLTQFLAVSVARGDLAIDDLELAAHHFIELCKADLFIQCTLGIRDTFSDADIHRVAEAAVTTFMRAYAP